MIKKYVKLIIIKAVDNYSIDYFFISTSTTLHYNKKNKPQISMHIRYA